jgi:hypothetical protein
MALTYYPKDAEKCLPAGDYQASLKHCEEKNSKAGNPMAVLTWEVYPDDSRPPVLVKDYIVLPDGTWKIKRLAQALSKETEFKNGFFQPEDEIGCSVLLQLKVEQQDGFDDKNAVKAYKSMGDKTKSATETNRIANKAGSSVKEQWQRIAAKSEEDVQPNFAPAQDTEDIPFGWLIGFALIALSMAGFC